MRMPEECLGYGLVFRLQHSMGARWFCIMIALTAIGPLITKWLVSERRVVDMENTVNNNSLTPLPFHNNS